MFKDQTQDLQTAGGVMGTEADPDQGINFVQQGPGAYQRIGSRFSVEELHVNGFFERLALPAVGNIEELQEFRCRVVIVLDKQCNGASTQYQQVFNNDVGYDGNLNDLPVDWKQRVENNKRFLILWDKIMTMKAPSAVAFLESTDTDAATTGAIARFEKKLKFKTPIVIEMGGSDPVIANVKSNNLICLVATDQHTDQMGPTVTVNTRILFTDR